MLSDTIIERNATILRNNINIPQCDTYDQWTSGSSSYGWLHLTYEIPLVLDNYYYCKYTYKFTTTNQSPAWQSFYCQGGNWNTATINNPVAGTEYTASGIVTPLIRGNIQLSYGTLYNGPSTAISGVTAYGKNILQYNVTELYYLLKCNGIVANTTELKTWCDQNLEWRPRGVDYDISNLVASQIENKVCISQGAVVANNFVETDGMEFYTHAYNNYVLRGKCYFDNASGVYVYNNSGGGTVTHTRVSAEEQDSPFKHKHKYILKITTNGTASPGAGGFYTNHTAAANKIFIEKFVAKIPVGYNVGVDYNPQGTGAVVSMITSNVGTGKWEEYAVLYKCGSSGSFGTGGHIYISGPNNTSVTWYVAYVNDCDITGKEYLKYYSVLPNKHILKTANIYDTFFDNTNLISNGACTKLETAMLPGGWTYDTEDYVGNAHASIVQPVGKGAGNFGGWIAINPNERYKVSMWIKCKADMTSFLTAIQYTIADKSIILGHTEVCYKASTRTTLTAPLTAGDTQMSVKSNANWASTTYSKVGFRSNDYISYNNNGTSNAPSGSTGMIAGIEGTTIVKFNTAYTGATKPTGTYVVESRDGATYPYPIDKNKLPTDNTWKYVEGYFGVERTTGWDGSSSSGQGWSASPAEARYISLALNIYGNTGTVPIKYCDIRVEQVSSGSGNRNEKKIQFNVEETE